MRPVTVVATVHSMELLDEFASCVSVAVLAVPREATTGSSGCIQRLEAALLSTQHQRLGCSFSFLRILIFAAFDPPGLTR